MLELSKDQIKELFYYKCNNCGTSVLNYLDVISIILYENRLFIKVYCDICKNTELRIYSIKLEHSLLKENIK